MNETYQLTDGTQEVIIIEESEEEVTNDDMGESGNYQYQFQQPGQNSAFN